MKNSQTLLLGAAIVALGVIAYIVLAKPEMKNEIADTTTQPVTQQETVPPAEDFEWRLEDLGSDDGVTPHVRLSLVAKNAETSVYNLGEYFMGCKGDATEPSPAGQLAKKICWWGGAGFEFGVFDENGSLLLRKRWIQESGGINADREGPWETVAVIK